MTYSRTRTKRKGSIMATAMLFFVVVTVAGTAILSMSTIQRIKTVRNGIDVRLMIAAEAGIESVRGRFTLIEGVQDDWSWLNNSTWTAVDTVNVNGINVTVEAMLWGGPSVPTARLRSSASASGKTRHVEYLIKVASFSDYAVFTGGTGSPGQDYKLVGNIYMTGDLNIGAGRTGVQFFGSTELTGVVNKNNGEPDSYTFPIQNPEPLTPPIDFPNNSYLWDLLVDKAETTGYIWAENTLEIEFMGSQMRRTYVQRNATGAGNGTRPLGRTWDGAGWCRPTDGATFYTHSYLNNTDYSVVSEIIDIPDEGVIYIRSGPATLAEAGVPNKDALGGRTNNFIQQVSGNSIAGSDTNIFRSTVLGNNYVPIVLISGRIDDRRVSIASDHKFVVKQPIVYDTLLNDPGLRRFYNDPSHFTGKQSQTALNMKEMLGLMSRDDIHPCVTWWDSLNSIYGMGGVTDDPLEEIPGHYPGDTYCMDGVFLALGDTSPRRHFGYASPPGGPLGEMWFNGGLIGQNGYGGGNANSFFRRQYDWDYRMALTMPPYFLNAYNTSATFVPGTWKTWES